MSNATLKPLKAYILYPYSGAVLSLCVYHHTSRQAKQLGVRSLNYDEYKLVTCVRYKAADKYGAAAPLPKVETDERVLRQLGWQSEDDENCGCCGLSNMGLNEQEICFDCDRCMDCGHVEGCVNVD